MCLDGDGQFQLMGLGSSAEMRTLGSPKFSSQFEHVGGSRLGHALLPSKAHQRLVKADYR